jgi:hypothetical protein
MLASKFGVAVSGAEARSPGARRAHERLSCLLHLARKSNSSLYPDAYGCFAEMVRGLTASISV